MRFEIIGGIVRLETIARGRLIRVSPGSESSMERDDGESGRESLRSDWQEGLIALAAHEFHHIYQFQNNLSRSEIECEKAALATLNLYRHELSGR
jgi:hypothetical protein